MATARCAALLLLLATAAHAQFMARCSNYQTTGDFDETFIETMRNQPGGYIVRLSNVVSDQCQRLQFVDGNDFNFTSLDVPSQTVHNYTDRYEVNTATVTMPAKLTLTLAPRSRAVQVLGGDSSGKLVLYPLVARQDMVAFAACHVSVPFMMREHVLVMTPYTDENATSIEEIKEVLNAQGVPQINSLFNISTECTPNPNATQPFSFFTIITNPFQRIAQVIPLGNNLANNAVVNNVGGVAEQTMAFLRGQYPSYVAQRGQQNTPAAAANSNLDAFQMASGIASTADAPKEDSEDTQSAKA